MATFFQSDGSQGAWKVCQPHDVYQEETIPKLLSSFGQIIIRDWGQKTHHFPIRFLCKIPVLRCRRSGRNFAGRVLQSTLCQQDGAQWCWWPPYFLHESSCWSDVDGSRIATDRAQFEPVFLVDAPRIFWDHGGALYPKLEDRDILRGSRLKIFGDISHGIPITLWWYFMGFFSGTYIYIYTHIQQYYIWVLKAEDWDDPPR